MSNVRLRCCLRKFTGPVDEFAVGTATGAWLVFKWAGHSKDTYAPPCACLPAAAFCLVPVLSQALT